MVAGAFDDGRRAAVADREPLTRPALGEEVSGGGAVEHGVAHDDVVARLVRCVGRGGHDDLATAEPLADVVVRLALEQEANATGQEGAEALARAALRRDLQGAIRQAISAMLAGDGVRDARTDG